MEGPLESVDIDTKQTFKAQAERSDVCAVPAACVVMENIIAWEIAESCLEKFGGDSLGEVKANFEGIWSEFAATNDCSMTK